MVIFSNPGERELQSGSELLRCMRNDRLKKTSVLAPEQAEEGAPDINGTQRECGEGEGLAGIRVE